MMNKTAISWAIPGVCCLVTAGISAYMNFACYKNYGGIPQPPFALDLHVVAAFVGAALLARFIQGSRHVMNEPPPGVVWGTTYIASARGGAYSRRVRAKSAFFSGKRTAQLIGFTICLMGQFIFVAAPQPDGLNPDLGRPAPHVLPA
jgi:hypothetical protein